MTASTPPIDASLSVLVLVEDAAFGELLGDAIAAAGLRALVVSDEDGLAAALDGESPGALVVDTDTRPRPVGPRWLATVRARWPGTRTVALVAFGTRADESLPCDAAVEKPARLRVIVDALRGVR